MDITTQISVIVFLCSFARTIGAGRAIINGPDSTIVEPNEWANFTCLVDCSRDIDWYVEGYSSDISETCSSINHDMMVCTNTTRTCPTSDSTTGFEQQLSVQAKPELAGQKIAVQCAAITKIFPINDECNPFIVYSRFAFLNVDILPTPVTTPAVCPSPTVLEVTVVTETETVTHTVVTSAVTPMQTVLVSVNGPECTPTPEVPTSANFHSGEGRLHLSRILKELFMWLCTLSVSLFFL